MSSLLSSLWLLFCYDGCCGYEFYIVVADMVVMVVSVVAVVVFVLMY